jgi:hypothetical protein
MRSYVVHQLVRVPIFNGTRRFIIFSSISSSSKRSVCFRFSHENPLCSSFLLWVSVILITWIIFELRIGTGGGHCQSPRLCVTSCNMLVFYDEEILAAFPTPQAGRPLLDGCMRLHINDTYSHLHSMPGWIFFIHSLSTCHAMVTRIHLSWKSRSSVLNGMFQTLGICFYWWYWFIVWRYKYHIETVLHQNGCWSRSKQRVE